ncbi:hypothetical protein FRC17_010893 [Serendipita sp. 399]|nr:hypothetical protein FRC17_010893 [Serendipita sp. 399]
MSKKWLNPPLSLRPKVTSSVATNEDPNDSTIHAGISITGVLSAPETPQSALNRDSLSEAQYAIAPPSHPHQFLDLPSAVPFQDALTPALPSAEFPSSVRGGASPPVTSSTANFGPSTDSIVAAYLPSSPSEVRHSEYSYRSLDGMTSDLATVTGHPTTEVATITGAGAALRRAESAASRASAWTVGDGSDYNFPLDITQFPRPPISDPGQGSEELSQVASFPTSAPISVFKRMGRLRPPASPLYEESEPSGSPVMTPVVGAVSYQYPVSFSERQDSILPMGSHAFTTQNASMLDVTGNHSLQVPASPALTTSARGSYQSHATAASRGSDSPRPSEADTFGQNSARIIPSPGWGQVMNVVKPNWNESEIEIQPTPPSPSSFSTKAAVGTNSQSGREEGGSTLVVPPGLSSAQALTPLSGESNSDVYSAIGRMSFPKPPTVLGSLSGTSSPVTPGPRSPWITGLTLRTRQSRGSLKRKFVEDTPLTSPITPIVPPIPSTRDDPNSSSSEIANSEPSNPLENIQDASAYSSSQVEISGTNAAPSEAPSQPTRNSGISAQAPSYDRRVSDLIRAAYEDPRMSAASEISFTTDSIRNSIDGAVVGVARTASLSARAKLLLTRGPLSIGDGSQEVTLPYVVPSPLPSAIPSELSVVPSAAPEIPSTTPLNLRTIDIRQNFLSSVSPLQRSPPIEDPAAAGAFPESVGSGQTFPEVGSVVSLQRYQLNDIPHSAVPLNQSTPFQNQFPSPVVPTSFKPTVPSSKLAVEHSNSPLPSSSSPHSLSKRLSNRSSILSSISKASSRAVKAISFFRKKPLPPVPNASTHNLGEKGLPHPDDDMSVPDLAKRAADMDEYLAAGELPYQSPITPSRMEGLHGQVPRSTAARMSVHSVLGSLSDRIRGDTRRTKRQVGFAPLPDPKLEANVPREDTPPNIRALRHRRKWVIFIVCVCISAIGLTAAILFGRPRRSGASVMACSDSAMTGETCQLNSTCICTSTAPGQCAPVAQNLLDLLPAVNDLFNMNITQATLALTLWDLQGQQIGSCAAQARLVDVAPSLNMSSSPKRTQWAQGAILYNLLQSYDLASTAALRRSVSTSDFRGLQGVDEPVSTDSSSIAFQASGFVYDFASMTLAPSAVDWKANSGADQVQISRVGFFADRALDRMYSFSTASSVQRWTALTRYWVNVLRLPQSDLTTFISSFSKSPVVLPINAFSPAISAFLNATAASNDGTSVVPPIACLADITTTGRNNTNLVEHEAFGLDTASATAPTTLDPSCFSDRPVYGLLDVLRLRRSFNDDRSSMRIPMVQLSTSATPRVVLHSGEQLVGLTGNGDTGVATRDLFSSLDVDPRQYGTMQHLNHIALTYLQSFPTTALARQAAQFITNAGDQTSPPAAGDSLFDDTNGFADLPAIEVALFGSVLMADVDVVHADLGTPNGTLFFGSERGASFRRWALRDEADVLVWSNSTSAARVVREKKESNSEFESVWEQAAELIKSAANIGRGTGPVEIREVVQALGDAGLLS